MGHWEICRVCTKCTKSDQLKNLFEKSSSKLIKKIEEITGILLKDLEQFPQHMCNACEDDLEKAYEFRERCIFAQEYFTTVEYREQTYLPKEDDGNAKCANTSTMKDELQPIEENFIEDICFLKEEPCEFQCQLEPVEPLEENQEDAEDTLAGTDKPHQPTEVEKQDNFEPELQTKSNSEAEKQKSKRKAGQNVRQHVDKPIVRTRKRKISDSKRSYICDQCGNSFTCRHRFKTHLRRHTGDKRFNCEVCPDKFFTHSELTRHMRKHTGEKPFECKHCGRRFSDYSTRIKHERTHTNERPFVCTQCTKAFTTSYILKNHMLVHTGERSFKCDLCSKAFQRQIHLDVHCRSLTHRQNEEKQKQKMFIT